jgi:hypothetical protein
MGNGGTCKIGDQGSEKSFSNNHRVADLPLGELRL